MWSELGADAKLYAALYWPERSGRWLRALVWLRSPGLFILLVQRLCHLYLAHRQQHGWTAGTITLRALYSLGPPLLMVLAKSDVAAAAVIGPGVYLSDRGYLVLGPRRIGSGTMIHERVTIGVRAGAQAQPVIGENVWIGPDCVIYGEISIGDDATVLPGSVLSMSVPARTVVGGNPALIVRRDFDNRALRRTLARDIDRDTLAPR